MGRRTVLASCLVACLAVPAPTTASAAKRFRGKTSQGRTVTVRVGDDGLVTRVAMRWRARCGGKRFVVSGVVFPGGFFTTSTRNRIAGRGPYKAKPRRGVYVRVKARISGRRRARRERWTGTLRTTATVRRSGRTIDRCRSGRIRWTARRVKRS